MVEEVDVIENEVTAVSNADGDAGAFGQGIHAEGTVILYELDLSDETGGGKSIDDCRTAVFHGGTDLALTLIKVVEIFGSLALEYHVFTRRKPDGVGVTVRFFREVLPVAVGVYYLSE